MVAFRRSRRSHIEIYSEEQEALKDVVFSTSYVHPSNSQREPVELSNSVMITRDVVVIRERPT